MELEGPTNAGLRYYDTGGNGPVVVLLHGVIMNGDVWREVVEGLRDRYRCVVPELPFGAHGRPMPDGADLTLPSIARMIAAFLVELDLHDVTLACNDWGGAQLVVEPGRSDRISRLVLVSCEAFDNYPPGLPGRLLCLSASVPGGLFVVAQMLRCRWLRHLPFTFGSLSKKRVTDERFLGWIGPLRRDRRIRRDLRKYLRHVPSRAQLRDWAERQRVFRGPVLIVWAREDKLMSAAHAERLAKHFENARLAWVDDSFTLIPIDQPEVLVRHMREFLGNAGGLTSSRGGGLRPSRDARPLDALTPKG